MSLNPVPADEVVAIAERAGAEARGSLVELAPAGTIRTFRVGAHVLRLDADPAGTNLDAAVLAMRSLAGAVSPPVLPELVASGRDLLGGLERPWLVYRWIDGPTLTVKDATERVAEVGYLLASLHGARVFDLLVRFRRQRPMTLMESFKAVSDQLRGWLLAREADGLSQDLLTLQLSDLQRAMRSYAMAQDHYFRTARRRVLLHGRPVPNNIVAAGGQGATLTLVNLEQTCLGDAAEDVATFALAAQLGPDEETALLDAYAARLEELGRPDPRFLLRFFPRKFLLQLCEPVAMLDRLGRLKRGQEEVLEDPVATLEELIEKTYTSLENAFNGLKGFVGGMRPVTAREVRSMGRLIAYEELLLAGRHFRIALTGLPYAGKTEVGATLARRLGHAYVNTTVLGRAVATAHVLLEQPDLERAPIAERVRRLFDGGLRIEPGREPPYYVAHLGSKNVTERLRKPDVQMAGATLLDDEAARLALQSELGHRLATQGMVIEGAYAAELAPGRVRQFHLVSDSRVRLSRLMSHRHDVHAEDEGEALLARLDQGAPSPPDGAVIVDAGARPAGSAALDILWHLLPPGRRPDPVTEGLHGRSPL